MKQLLSVLCVAALWAGPKIPPSSLVNRDLAMPEMLKQVGIEQKLNSQIPMEAEFTDSHGINKPLRQWMNGRPAVLLLVYYECPMLCGMELNGLLRALRALPLTAGKEFDVLTVSFDPKDTPKTAAAKRGDYLQMYRRPEGATGWHFLTGGEAEIKKLTSAVGYGYQLDANTGQWAHASGIMVLTPEGRVSKYFYGVEYSARDLRLGLVEAGRGKIGTIADQFLLFCYHYDPSTGKYGMVVLNIVRAGGILTVLGILAFWWVMHRRGKQGKLNQDVDRVPVIS
ncbi:MAG: SCO family protein [Acidimicrobiia bacterium]|nr:SCO family protein [Acidimicrobiia bacterium]